MTDKKLECFVISPIGSPGTSIRKEADWVLKKLVRPALADTYNVVRADEFTKGEIITNRVITSIQNADLLVAVMSGHNPNVFYELAVAHAYSKPVIPLIKDGESIPFDVGFVGTIFYSHDDVVVWDAAIDQLKAAAASTLVKGYESSNPITMALGAAKASASPNSSDQLVSELTSQLAKMRSELAELRAGIAPQQYDNALVGLGAVWHKKAREYEFDQLLDHALQWSTEPIKAARHSAIQFEEIVEHEEKKLGRDLTSKERTTLFRKFIRNGDYRLDGE